MACDYTEYEICKIFRNADENKDRIKLLNELTCIKEKDIIEILIRNNYSLTSKEAKANRKVAGPLKSLIEVDFIRLYNEGLNDKQISERLPVSQSTIQRLRNELGYKPNY